MITLILLTALLQEPRPAAPDPALLLDLGPELRVTEAEYRAFLRDAIGSSRLDELVWDRLLERACAGQEPETIPPTVRAALADPAAELQRRLAALITTDHGGDRQLWRAQVVARGRTEAEELRIQEVELLRELRATALVQARREPGPEALKRVFEEHFGRDGLQLTAEHVLVSFHQVADEAGGSADEKEVRARARARAAAIVAQAGGSGSLQAQGGAELRPGWDQLFGAEFADAVRALEAGVVAGPIESRVGFHAVRVVQRVLTRPEDVEAEVLRRFRAAPPTLGEIRRLREELFRASGADQALSARLSR